MSEIFSVSEEDIKIFREWLEMQCYLPQDVDDNTIRAFIIGAKGSVQKAKIRFDNFYKSLHTMQDIMDDFDPLSNRAKYMNEAVAFCNIVGKEYSVIITRLLTNDSTHFDVPGYFARHYYNTQMQLWDNTLGNGQTVYILDFQGSGLGHVKGVTPMIAERLVGAIMNSSPIRFKAVHLLRLPTAIEWAVNIFLQFLPEKLRKRVRAHSSVETLQKFVDLKYLPQDFGGEMEPIKVLYEKHLKRLEHYREKFIAQKELRQAEAKRRPSDENAELPGTFRKLAID